MKKENLLKPRETSYQKTESVLYNYNNFKKAIENKLEQIQFIESEGIGRRSTSIVLSGGNRNINTDTEIERTEAAIEQIENSIEKLNRHIRFIDAALDTVRDDNYFEIIELMYFEGKTREAIAEYFEVDVSTITRNKNRLIHTLKIYLFPENSIVEFFD